MANVTTADRFKMLRARLRNPQLEDLVTGFVAIKYPTIPHFVLAADHYEATLLADSLRRLSAERDVETTPVMDIRTPTDLKGWSEFATHLEWLKTPVPNFQRVLIVHQQNMALEGWRMNIQCGLSCTYMLDIREADQLRARVSQFNSLNKSPALVAELPTVHIL